MVDGEISPKINLVALLIYRASKRHVCGPNALQIWILDWPYILYTHFKCPTVNVLLVFWVQLKNDLISADSLFGDICLHIVVLCL